MKRLLVGVVIIIFFLTQSTFMVAAASAWDGEWDTNWGKMTLTQTGNTVSGTYTHNAGRIEAQVVGNKIVGNWYQSNGSGKMEFEMDSDGAGFQGKWRYNNSGTWNSWTARKAAAAPSGKKTWAGTWDTTWGKMVLNQSGSSVTGTYAFKDGRIEAQAVGNKIIGNWYQSNGSGQIEFEMINGGANFLGKWKYANNASWSGNAWSGKRL